jgi:hypothetical protein
MKNNVYKPKFYRHLIINLFLGWLFICLALYLGMWGYHRFENMSWIDAFVNAAMILSGMGPLNPLTTYAGKLFAGFYALFSGLSFIIIIGLVFAPVIHRFFRKIHLELQEDSSD